uniref:NADH-ubiquinone oxidoreductase chain 4 n=1 Tax=Neoseiulus womersleyi TaxID=322050 RepID=A0A8F6YDQ7_9ACAR|nr:NADH dehydrogenase subunit 4 [Neoseiulus womersleyi]
MLFSYVFMYLFFVMFNFSLFQFFSFFCVFVLLMSVDLEKFLLGFFNLNNYLFLDTISGLMIFLSVFIMFCVYMMNYCKGFKKDVLFLLSLMLVFLCFCFMCNYMLMMYVCFEIVFVPLMLLIMYKGASPERFSASVNMFIYTFFGSLMFLLLLLVLDISYVLILSKVILLCKNGSYLFLMVFFVFLVKIPMYFTHLWLPKAHVQASVEISMLLAGILLKLGGFGLIRLFFMFDLSLMWEVVMFLMVLNIFGGMVISVVCLAQVDFKKLIAYSSVSHMGLMLAGLLSLSVMGQSGGVMMMVSHGFCSSCLFFMGNMYYERVSSRNLVMFKGVINLFPVLSIYWLLLIFINMGVPPFMNFMSEIILLMSLLKKSLFFIFFLSFMMMFTVFFCLSLFLNFGHGMLMEQGSMQEDSYLDLIIINLHLYFLFIYLWKISFLLIF